MPKRHKTKLRALAKLMSEKAAAKPTQAVRAKPAPPVPVEFKPVVRFEAVVIPQGGGQYLVSPAKPVVEQDTDEIDTAEFARRVGKISQSYVQQLVAEGVIVGRRMSPKPTSKFLIKASEVARYLESTKEIE
jgi:hypothetical protein